MEDFLGRVWADHAAIHFSHGHPEENRDDEPNTPAYDADKKFSAVFNGIEPAEAEDTEIFLHE
jgi:hypothetical protein